MSIDLLQIAALVAVGLVAGVLGGMLGVGGSIIMIPFMAQILHGGRQHLYQAAAMIVNVFVAAPAAFHHWAAKAVVRPVLRSLVPGAVIGVIVGVALSNIRFFQGSNAERLAKVFAVFLVYVTVYNLYRLAMGNRRPETNPEDAPPLPAWQNFSVGAVMGLAGGLTGIGGGALAVPMQQIFLRLPLRRAIANSAFTIVFVAVIGSVYKNATLFQQHIAISESLIVAACLIPSAFVGSYLGAHLTHRLPRQPVRIVFILVLMWGVWRMWTMKSKGPAEAPPVRPAARAVQSPPARPVDPAAQSPADPAVASPNSQPEQIDAAASEPDDVPDPLPIRLPGGG